MVRSAPLAFRSVVAAVILLSSIPAFAQTVTLSGRVTDALNPIAGALVEVLSIPTGTVVNSATSDSSGLYSIEVPPSTYDIRVTPPAGSGFASFSRANQALMVDTLLDIALVPGGAVALNGHVLDAVGAGLPNQSVQLTPAAGGASQHATTDAVGAFSFSAAAGNYRLTIMGTNPGMAFAAPGNYFLVISDFTLTGPTTFDVALPLERVDVHVQDAAATAVAGAGLSASANMGCLSVTVASPFGPLPACASATYSYTPPMTFPGMPPMPAFGIVTDSGGDATLWLFGTPPSLPPPPVPVGYTITATPPAGSAYSATTVSGITVAGPTTLTVSLMVSTVLNGRVLDGLGVGLPNQSVRLISAAGGADQHATTDAMGAFSFSAVAGSYRLSIMGTNPGMAFAAPGNYHLGISDFTLTGPTTFDVALPLERVDVHVQDAAATAVAGAGLSASANMGCLSVTVASPFGPLPACASATYSYTPPMTFPGMPPMPAFGIVTDSWGDATLWLFGTPPSLPPTPVPVGYTITATPPPDSPFVTVNVNGVTVEGDKALIVVLQFTHDPPQSVLTPRGIPGRNGAYREPAHFELSATAASGYSVASLLYSIDGGPAQDYVGPIEVTGVGTHTIRYWAVDNSGVYEIPRVFTFAIADARNTPIGSLINVDLGTPSLIGLTVVFSQVTAAGTTSAAPLDPSIPPDGFQFGTPPLVFDVSTTATVVPPIDLCVQYDPASFVDEAALRFLHFEGGAWLDRTLSLDVTSNTICARVMSLSPFAVAERALSPGRMHGGGHVAGPDNSRVEFEFSVTESNSGDERGRVNIRVKDGRQRASNDRFTAKLVDYVSFTDATGSVPGRHRHTGVDTVVFTGTGQWEKQSDYRYSVTASDRGEPGGGDIFEIQIWAPDGQLVFRAGGVLARGNIQAEPNRLRQ